MKKENINQKTEVPFLAETQHFLTKLLCQKPILEQIGWGLQNGPFAKNGVLSVTFSLF